MYFKPTQVNIGSMEINNTDHLGSVSFGSAYKVNRNVAAKKNQGFGQQHADFCFRYATVCMLLDDDQSDSFTLKTNKKSTHSGG